MTLNFIWKTFEMIPTNLEIYAPYCLLCYYEEKSGRNMCQRMFIKIFHRSYNFPCKAFRHFWWFMTWDVRERLCDLELSDRGWQGRLRYLESQDHLPPPPSSCHHFWPRLQYTRWRQCSLHLSISCKAEQRRLLQGWQTDKKVWDWKLCKRSVRVCNILSKYRRSDLITSGW